MGVAGGAFRRRLFFWQLVAEVRRVALILTLLLLLARPAAVQLYAMWGVLALLLIAEWALRPGATWALRALQLLVLGVVQSTVYLASGFTSPSLEGASEAFGALIILLNLAVLLAAALSLLPALRGPLLQLLDADQDGKISGKDVLDSASRLVLCFNRQRRGDGGSDDGATTCTATVR